MHSFEWASHHRNPLFLISSVLTAGHSSHIESCLTREVPSTGLVPYHSVSPISSAQRRKGKRKGQESHNIEHRTIPAVGGLVLHFSPGLRILSVSFRDIVPEERLQVFLEGPVSSKDKLIWLNLLFCFMACWEIRCLRTEWEKSWEEEKAKGWGICKGPRAEGGCVAHPGLVGVWRPLKYKGVFFVCKGMAQNSQKSLIKKFWNEPFMEKEAYHDLKRNYEKGQMTNLKNTRR